MYIDLDGKVEGISHKTGARVVGNFVPKYGSQNSKIEGFALDSSGNRRWEISGTWHNSI